MTDKVWANARPMEGDEWRIHDGTDKRPKDKRPKRVGKRDVVEIQYRLDGDRHSGRVLQGWNVAWSEVTHYRIIERAPKNDKRRKVWVVTFGGSLRAYSREADARTERAVNGGTLCTAKLTPVKDADK